MEEINVGYKFKQIRENAGLTLKQVSAMSGLSVSFISQIERGVVDPSWSSLKKISAALNIKLKDLFDEPPRPYTLVRDGQGYQSATHHIRREFLASMDNASMEMILTSFPPHSSSGTIPPSSGRRICVDPGRDAECDRGRHNTCNVCWRQYIFSIDLPA